MYSFIYTTHVRNCEPHGSHCLLICMLGFGSNDHSNDALWLQTPGPRPRHQVRQVWDLVSITSSGHW